MKLYFDEHIPPVLAQILQQRGLDCLTTQRAGNLGASDEDQLAYATRHGRTLLTFDRNDFLALAKIWASTGRPHAGIILSDQGPLPELLRRILRLATQRGQDDLSNQIIWLHNYKGTLLP